MSSTAAQVRSRIPRMAEVAVERARLRVVPRRRTRAPRVPFVTLVSLLLLTGVIGLLLFNTSMQQASFAATALEQQATNLAARQQSLQMDLDRLRDPQRVGELARQQGLVLSPGAAVLRLPSGKIEGTPTAATRENDVNIQPPAPILPAELAPPPIIKVAGGRDGRGNGDRSGQESSGEANRGSEGDRGRNSNQQNQESQQLQQLQQNQPARRQQGNR